MVTRLTGSSDPYFLDFINLPARAYKEYFAVITNPLSIKGLQKQVKGIHGRAPATGVSDFKSWTAFEERASLLWTNAHFFNEPDSKIYLLATELKVRVPHSLFQIFPNAPVRNASKRSWLKPRRWCRSPRNPRSSSGSRPARRPQRQVPRRSPSTSRTPREARRPPLRRSPGSRTIQTTPKLGQTDEQPVHDWHRPLSHPNTSSSKRLEALQPLDNPPARRMCRPGSMPPFSPAQAYSPE